MPLHYEDDGPPPKHHPVHKGGKRGPSPHPNATGADKYYGEIAAGYEKQQPNSPRMSLSRATGDWYGDKASTYNNDRAGNEKWEREIKGVAHLLRDVKPTDTLLDLACGTGRFFPIYDELGINKSDTVGVDVSAEMLSQAARDYPGVNLVEMDLRKLGESNIKSDHVVCMRLVEKMTEGEAAQAVGLMGHIAEKSIVFGCLVGKDVAHRNRSNVHRLHVLEEAMAKEGFRIEEHCLIREPDYYIFKAGRA